MLKWLRERIYGKPWTVIARASYSDGLWVQTHHQGIYALFPERAAADAISALICSEAEFEVGMTIKVVSVEREP